MWFLALAHAASWGPCVGIDTAPGAECTTVSVLEDYGSPGRGASLVSLTVARIPSAAPATKHLWVTAPEPGGSALAELVTWADRPLPDDVALYAVDHRGVGPNRLGCPDQEAATSAGGARIEVEEIGPCSDYLAPDVEHLAFVDATQSGGDLMEVSEQLKEGADVFFVGSGYGAFLLQRALVLSGRPEGVILDGPWPDDVSIGALDADIDRQAEALLARCEGDAACTDALKGGVGELVDAFLEAPGACDAWVNDADARRHLAAVTTGPPELQGLLPAVLARSVRCNQDDVEALLHLRGAVAAAADHPGASPAAALRVAYGELWRDEAPPDDAFLASTGWARDLHLAQADWVLPFEPSRPRYPVYQRPMLLLHPELAPLATGDVAGHYPWMQHHHVDVDGAFGSVTATDCGQDLVRRFLEEPRSAPAPCEAAVDFEGSPAIDRRWLGVEDRWGRRRCGCTSAGARAAGGWALLMPALWLSRRRATRRSRSPR